MIKIINPFGLTMILIPITILTCVASLSEVIHHLCVFSRPLMYSILKRLETGRKFDDIQMIWSL